MPDLVNMHLEFAQVAELQSELNAAAQARDQAEEKLANDRKSFQTSHVLLGAGQSHGDAVASLKQRMWALRNELEDTKIERDKLKRQCVRS